MRKLAMGVKQKYVLLVVLFISTTILLTVDWHYSTMGLIGFALAYFSKGMRRTKAVELEK